MPTVVLSARVDRDLAHQIDTIAASQRITRGDFVNDAIRRNLERVASNKPAPMTSSKRIKYGELRRSVATAMQGGEWYYLETLADILGLKPEEIAGMHRRMRELREPRHGGYTLDKGAVDVPYGEPVRWQYRLVK